ncbi:unnamed protein product, partial [Iphiclides podalirius]
MWLTGDSGRGMLDVLISVRRRRCSAVSDALRLLARPWPDKSADSALNPRNSFGRSIVTGGRNWCALPPTDATFAIEHALQRAPGSMEFVLFHDEKEQKTQLHYRGVRNKRKHAL